MALSDKSKRVVFIINAPSDNSIHVEGLRDLLDSQGLPAIQAVRYAYILHSLDVKDDGTIKTPHYHLFAETKTSCRVGTNINKMAKALGISPLCVSCEVCASEEGAIQYLIHKNDPEKHQYPTADIVSNIDRGELDLIMDRPSQAFSVDYILYVWNHSHTFPEFVKAIGIEKYNKYRYLIRDLIGYSNHS